ncbi:soluble lytic murein transglycosylase [Novosphingobium sp. SG751A]|uniref:lytic transglycosylase domain-containing protein n=1 Tax=Novosphingobium sp. SG751A TaxID=2587000 RepID=UPI001556C999|nr:soluble lytic murein transglycosylase [Novosphingobium sp. SG751A]
MSSTMMPRSKSTSARRRRRIASLALLAMAVLSVPAQCQEGAEWDRARAELKAGAPGAVAPAIARWKSLVGTENQGFDAYAGFVLAWPGFPLEESLRRAAEKSLAIQNVSSARIVALFDRFPPLTNPARAQYALALAAEGRARDAADVARAAWRGGAMSDAAEAAILSRWGDRFAQTDHDSRLEALLWDGSTAQAARALTRASQTRWAVAQARLAIQQGAGVETPMVGPDAIEQVAATARTADEQAEMARITAEANPGLVAPAAPAAPTPALMAATPEMLSDPGYLVDRARYLIRRGRGAEAASLLATRPPLARPALDPRRWTGVLLAAARAGGPSDSLRIAQGATEGFPEGSEIAQMAFGVRDDYTSLMWLGGTTALWQLRNPEGAAQLFYNYAHAARTPMTRAKGYYWAGRALDSVGQTNGAFEYYRWAAQFPDQFHGLLALERLGLPIPPLHDGRRATPTHAQARDFAARPITQAVREVARDAEWQTTIRFFREIANQAKVEADFTLVADLARALGRRDLAVIVGQAAENAGFNNFRDSAFPITPTPPGSDWTWIHAISRQESQFSQNAMSRTGARGLMQLMPGTAAEQARRLGLPSSTQALIDDPLYNTTLGNAYFQRLVSSYRGSYPLAVAAYNAGPGNVNKWIASRGDPRMPGGPEWVEWIEKIPFSETRSYVAHVLENAVTYEAMYPDHAAYKGANPLSHYLKDPRPAPPPPPAVMPAPMGVPAPSGTPVGTPAPSYGPQPSFTSSPVVQPVRPGQ